MKNKQLFTEVQGLNIHTLQAGSGERAIILLHGGGIDSAMLSWELLIPELADDFCVYAPDWPGFGLSSTPDTPYQLSDCVELLQDLMKAWNLEQADLLGISLGGGIALGFTLQNPDRVNRLVLVDSYGLQKKVMFHRLSYLYVHFPFALELTWLTMKSRAMTRWALKKLFYNPQRVTQSVEDQVFTEIKKPGSGKAFAAIQKHDVTWEGLRTCYMDRLVEIKLPTLIVHGEQDNLVPLVCSQQAHQMIAGSQLHIIEKCGHWPQRDCPEEFNRVVKEFLCSSG
jgi:pimeloyl-ACP methyl ester carboxylesterase